MQKTLTLRTGALIWLVLSLLVIVFDQLTKAIVLHVLQPYQPHPVIPGILNWTLAFNPGIAFSFLADQPGWQRWPLVALAAVISAILARWLANTPRRDWRTALPLALVIAGALGNMIDRVLAGHVTVFIKVYYREWVFPSFNVADSSISIGAVLLVWFSLFGKGKGRGA